MIMRRNRVAVINDDPAQLTLIRRILESDGLPVTAFLDPVEALERLPELSDLGLIVLDLNMPRVDGWKACRTIRSPDYPLPDEIPILIVSATFQGPGFERITRSRGASGFLASPFTHEDLVSKARALLTDPLSNPEELVLIVEDDESVRDAVNKAFTRAGFRTHVEATVEGGWRASESMRPTTYVLDRTLPDGRIDSFLARLNARPGGLGDAIVLIMTGDTDPDLPIRLLGMGADGFVRKPFAPQILVELVRRASRERMLLGAEATFERTAETLRGSEARYAALFDSVPDMIFAVDGSGVVTAANRHATDALETTGQGLVGLGLSDFLRTENGRRIDRATLASAVGRGVQATLLGPGGAHRPIEIVASPADRVTGACVVVARDIGERLALEEERAKLTAQASHRQRLESLGIVAGGIAHDFNNLLQAMGSYVELALASRPDPTMEGYLGRIGEAAARATELTGQMLTFAGRGSRRIDQVSLGDLVPATVDLVGQTVSSRGALVRRFAPDLPPVEGDRTQLTQVIMNLVLNAAESLEPAGGTVTVETRLDRLTGREATATYLEGTPRPGQYVALTVRDDGCGMSPDTLGRIFDPFFTTKVDGRGLGLAVSLGIVRAHGGLVRVESEPGFGTEFTLLFPVSRTALAGPHGRPERVRPAGSVSAG